ncbi:MAG: hypothetical protein KOO63_05275 [Bacteroidales bacterium]|nr:hypothetical protein [Candidatus Latescibacterota bacterium]
MYQVDYKDDNTIVEVKKQLTGVRDFRNVLLQIVHYLTLDPEKNGYLLLIDPKMGKESLKVEFRATWDALKPDIARRLNYFAARNGKLTDGSTDAPFQINDILHFESELPGKNQIVLPRPNLQSEIFRVLILSWIEGRGLLTSHGIAKTVGCSYRTVAKALDKLGSAIERNSDRRVQLRYFPKEMWREFAATAKSARATVMYTDHSGQPRSINSLYKRIVSLQRPDLAIGGGIGAQRHFGDLDLVGAPRLDLCVHAHDKMSVHLPMDRIDPGLKETRDPEQPVRLAVHFLRRRKSFFAPAVDGSMTADPVECLLDLFHGRLKKQAHEFMTYLESQGKSYND